MALFGTIPSTANVVAGAITGTISSASLPAGSIVQLKTKLGSLSRFSSSSSSWVEVDSSIRVSLTPTKASNLILVYMSCHVHINDTSQISVLPTFSTNAGTTFQSMVAEKDSGGGLAASSVISTGGSMGEHFRVLSGNGHWWPHTIHAIITASSTSEHLFSTHVYATAGSMDMGDNGNEHRITVMEIAV
jgi:hypothetical protein